MGHNNNPILVHPNRDPLFGHTREELLNKFRHTLTDRVQEAWIFGSLAQGTLRPYSDIDLILVCATETLFVQRPFEFDDLLDIIPAMDILVYTPREFEKLTTDPSPGFWRSVVRTMQRIL